MVSFTRCVVKRQLGLIGVKSYHFSESRGWFLLHNEQGEVTLTLCGLNMLGYARNGAERNIALGALVSGCQFGLIDLILVLASQICSKSGKEEGLKAVLHWDVILASEIDFPRLDYVHTKSLANDGIQCVGTCGFSGSGCQQLTSPYTFSIWKPRVYSVVTAILQYIRPPLSRQKAERQFNSE